MQLLCCAALQLLLLSLLAPVGRGLEDKYNDNALLKNTGDVQAVYDMLAKQWSGLIKDYYAARIRLHQRQALADAAKGRPLDTNATAALEAEHAYNWTTAHNAYPTPPVGDAIKVSAAMQKKYESYFTSC